MSGKLDLIDSFKKSALRTKQYIDNNSGGGKVPTNLPPILPPVAFTGSFLDLIDRPNIPNSFSTVAETGDYNDLINRPPDLGELEEELSDWIDITFLIKYNKPKACGIVFNEYGILDKQQTVGGSYGTYQSLIDISPTSSAGDWRKDERYLQLIEGCSDFDIKIEIKNFQLGISYLGYHYWGTFADQSSYGSKWDISSNTSAGSYETGGYILNSSVDTTTDPSHWLLNLSYELYKVAGSNFNQSGADYEKSFFKLCSGNTASASGRDINYTNVDYETSFKLYIRPRKTELKYPNDTLMGQYTNFIMDKLNTKIGTSHYQVDNCWIDITKDLHNYGVDFDIGLEGQILSLTSTTRYQIFSIPRTDILSVPSIADYITKYQQETGVTIGTNNPYMMVEFVDIPANTSSPTVNVRGQYTTTTTVRNIKPSPKDGLCYVSGFARTGIQLNGSTYSLSMNSNYTATNEMLPTSCVRVYITFDNGSKSYVPNVNEYEFTGDLQKVYNQAVKDAVRTIIDIITGNEN